WHDAGMDRMMRPQASDRPIPLRFDDDELFERDRRSWTRSMLASYVIAKQSGVMPEELVKKTWPHDDRAFWLTKAAVSPDSTTSSASALTYTRVNPLLLIAPPSAAAKLFDRCMRLDFAGVLQYSVPHVGAHPLPIFVA